MKKLLNLSRLGSFLLKVFFICDIMNLLDF